VSRGSFALALFLGAFLLVSGADAEHHKKKKDGDALTECTIQGSGGGCTTGFKRVCEKLKNGKKCCGCVPDENSKSTQSGKAAPEADKGTTGTSTTTTPGNTAKCNILFGDYCNLPDR